MDENKTREETAFTDAEGTEIVTSVDDTGAGEEIGNIKISAEVVSTIAGMAATEIEGVHCMYSSFAGGIAEMFGARKNQGKGVKVEITENSVLLDLYIVVDYGVRIPELAWEIQENVKNNVETMTGMNVEKVNIHIEGVSFEKEEENTPEIPETPNTVNEEPVAEDDEEEEIND